jgi:uncharacterized membrane protein
MANCLARRTPDAIFLGTLGFGLFLRGLTNLELTRCAGLTGSGRGHRPHEVQKTVTIHAPVEEVFEFRTRCENFPRFMALREVRDLGNGRSHWVAIGPAGVEASWTAVLTHMLRLSPEGRHGGCRTVRPPRGGHPGRRGAGGRL